MQAAIMPFIWNLQQWGLISEASPSKNRPTLNQNYLTVVGRSLGVRAIGAAASTEANCNRDSGYFKEGLVRPSSTS